MTVRTYEYITTGYVGLLVSIYREGSLYSITLLYLAHFENFAGTLMYINGDDPNGRRSVL